MTATMYDLPLFPLNTVLFPGMPIHLHVFEERYRLLLQRCLKGNRCFGVVLIRQGVEALGPLANPHLVGCSARIIEVMPLEEGHTLLTAIGEDRFRVLSLNFSEPYLTGKVEGFPLHRPLTLETLRARRPLAARVHFYLNLLKSIDSAEALDLDEISLPEDPLMLMNMAAALLQIPAAEKQPLLAAESGSALLAGVGRLYRREIAVLSRLAHVNDQQAERAAWLN